MAATLTETSVNHEGDPRTLATDSDLRYVVRMEGLPVGTFTGCDGLPDGGDFGFGRPGMVRLTRRVARDSAVLGSWLATRESPDGCTVVITAYDRTGRPVRAWRLRDARPVRYDGPPSGAKEPLETLELAHSGVLSAAP